MTLYTETSWNFNQPKTFRNYKKAHLKQIHKPSERDTINIIILINKTYGKLITSRSYAAIKSFVKIRSM